jgi:ankyrin repeat protein
VDVAEHDRNGSPVLHAAAAGGDVELVSQILAEGADANVTDAAGMTPLHYVLMSNMHLVQPNAEAMMRVLARHGARTDIAAKGDGPTALKMADTGLAPVKAMFHEVFRIEALAAQTDR